MHDPYSTTERGTGYYLRHPIPPPPPEWSMKQQRSVSLSLFIVLSVVTGILLLLVISASLLYWSVIPRTSLTSVGTTPIPTVNASYTANDILRDFKRAGAHMPYIEYGTTIWSWSSNTYYVSVDATSSVTFTDDSGCSGYCDPQNIGLWVYSDPETGHQTYNEVIADEQKPVTPTGPTIGAGLDTTYVHGRCLLLGASASSIYGQVVAQYCI